MDRQRKAVVSIQLEAAVRTSSGQEKTAATALSLPLVAALTGSRPNWGKEQTVAAGAKSLSTAVARWISIFHSFIICSCKDQYTFALGPNLEGCPCGTSEYGCCEDGKKVADGPNGEGCLGCQASEHGCCPDNFTPASGPGSEGCGCSGSPYGCCPDGLAEATGEDFEGCEVF